MNKNIWPLLGVGIGLGAAILPVMARAPEPVPSLYRFQRFGDMLVASNYARIAIEDRKSVV